MSCRVSASSTTSHSMDMRNDVEINVEIERFTKGVKDVTNSTINEEMGYPIDTEVRVKKNGTKGTIIGVDGNSRTYTVIFKDYYN